jgi:membrane associated rhomboid family serine protease
MRYIVFISAAVFLISIMDTQGRLIPQMRFIPDYILEGQVWRLITWVFIPIQGNPIFTAIALYFYYFIGTTLEREWGKGKFTIYYALGILLNIIGGFIIRYTLGTIPLVIPIFLNFSLFFAFAVLFPDFTIRLFLIIPIKIKWAALLNAAFFLWSIISALVVQNFAEAFMPVIALLNFFLICGNDLLSRFRPLKAQGKSQFSSFKKEAKKTKRNIDSQPYRHKCEVCGKTDTEYPDLEFRYCSRCEGYHCFCIDHIDRHVHFK